MYSFLAHLHNATVDHMNDVASIRNGMNIGSQSTKLTSWTKQRSRRACRCLTTVHTLAFIS